MYFEETTLVPARLHAVLLSGLLVSGLLVSGVSLSGCGKPCDKLAKAVCAGVKDAEVCASYTATTQKMKKEECKASLGAVPAVVAALAPCERLASAVCEKARDAEICSRYRIAVKTLDNAACKSSLQEAAVDAIVGGLVAATKARQLGAVPVQPGAGK